MNLLGAVIGGAIGAALGAALWVGVSYGTGYEIGWIAWGVGLLAGLGVAFGSRGTAGAPGGIVAVILAVAAIVLAKYMVVQLVIDDALRADGGAFHVPSLDDEGFWTTSIADEIAAERIEAGTPINWPPGVDPDQASSKEDYPAELWSEANSRWMAMSEDQKSEYRDELVTASEELHASLGEFLRNDVGRQAFKESFGAMDILFGLLAIVTAFKVGSAAGQRGAGAAEMPA